MCFVGLASWALFNGFCSAGSLGCLVLTQTTVSVARSLVPSVVALECVVPCPRGVSKVQGGSACGPSTLCRSKVAVPMVRRSFSHGFSVSLVVTPSCSFPTSWRSGMLGACVVRLWSHVVAPVFRELLCLGKCVPRCCFHFVFDSTGSAGVVFGPTLVAGRGITLFRCFVVLCIPATLAGKGLVIPTEPCSRGSPPYSLQVASFPTGSECELQESVAAVAGCACCEHGCYFRSYCSWIHPRAVRSGGCVIKAERTYVWCGLHRCRVVVCGTGRRTVSCCPGEACSQDYSGLVFAGCCATSGLRYVVVVLAGAFWWVSQNGALVVLVEVLPGPACVASAVLLAAVFSLMVRVVWSFGLCVLVKVLPRISPYRFWWRFFPGVLGVCLGYRYVAPFLLLWLVRD
ncbi:hypothetical protein Taro_029043 [Colocasia esculenta]|uniref:Uncharacterized protein n=1 Tax=Colocasia esculenta TaxID=4460 RepID=A0A843VI00_COLES|nr:hypothetical protein [Colocasia esculenta]